MAGFLAASQLSDALHLHVRQLVLQSAVLSGVGKIRGSEIKDIKQFHLNCEAVVQGGKAESSINVPHLGLQPSSCVMLMLMQIYQTEYDLCWKLMNNSEL